MSDDRVADIPSLLFQRLASLDPVFIPSEYMSSYACLTTNLERINFVFEDIKKCNIFPDIERDAKNDIIAAHYRQKGNEHFRLGKYRQALEEYTRSVATAKTENVLALAYANRSACLYRLNLYKNCLTDIERAFNNNYPKDLEEKLITRREQAQRLQKPIIDEGYYEKIPVVPDSEKNRQIQSARNSVKIEVNEEFGRHVVAVKEIPIGEEISVEESFASVVIAERWIHCNKCLELCYNPIPCNNCTQALFCSDTCRNKAQSFHQYECPLLLSIIEFGMVNSILIALKIAILAKEDYGNVKKFNLNKDHYRSDRYREIHSLYTPARKLSEHDSFYRAVVVSVLFHFLQTTSNFFENKAIEDGFKEVMLHQMQVVISNGVNIYEYAKEDTSFDRTHFAGGVYSFFSLFNHSCCPNVEGSFYGSTIVLRAVNTIKTGQQCYINYDTHYGTTPKPARQEMLSKHFFFNCKCTACEEDWEAELVDFHVNHIGICEVEEKLSVADVRFAKYILPYLIKELKKCERSEPWGKALTLKKMICSCYITLGNKRRI